MKCKSDLFPRISRKIFFDTARLLLAKECRLPLGAKYFICRTKTQNFKICTLLWMWWGGACRGHSWMHNEKPVGRGGVWGGSVLHKGQRNGWLDQSLWVFQDRFCWKELYKSEKSLWEVLPVRREFSLLWTPLKTLRAHRNVAFLCVVTSFPFSFFPKWVY